MLLDKVTKDYILNIISEEEIFEYYLGEPVTKELFCSPLRNDKNPTCKFYRKNGTLRMKDFQGHFFGDCFDLIAYRMNTSRAILDLYKVDYIDVTKSQHFVLILDLICRNFKLHKYKYVEYYFDPFYDREKTNIKIEEKDISVIEVKLRVWNNYDYLYWFKKYNVTKNILERNKVYPIKAVWINNKLFYDYRNTSKVCYGYYLGKTKDIDIWKLYLPENPKPRYFTNGAKLQGIWSLPQIDEVGIVHKGLKEKMIAESFGFNGIAVSSESNILTEEQNLKFSNIFEHKFTLFDYDNTGIHYSWVMRKQYNYTPLFIKTPKVFSRKHYIMNEVKDLGDYINYYGAIKTGNDIENYYNQLFKQNF